VILESLDGPEVPRHWRGAGTFTYRAGSGEPSVRMRVKSDDRIRPVWTVTGLIRGSTRPEEIVIVGNHRDAWVYGGVDPSSGSAALIELARALGAMTRNGWRPERSILFASWDAEEFALTSSTEWGEQHEAWLRRSAVAYLNVDSAASGPGLSVTAVPALNQVIEEALRIVRDPESRLTLAATARDRRRRVGGDVESLIDNRLGSGSDYTVPGRPWYRHLIYAPRFTYAPEVLPGASEAIEAGDGGRARAQARRLADGLRRAAAALDRLN
jgi:N-acetylated-alpha-linked acidic dipeptidase